MGRLAGKRVAFAAKFFLVFGAGQALLLGADLRPLLDWIAGLVGGWTGLAVQGNRIVFAGGAFAVTENCSGLFSVALLAGLVFAGRRPGLRGKLALLGVGAAGLFALNLARLYGVVEAGKFGGAGTAEALHVGSWFLTGGLVLFYWKKGMEKAVGSLKRAL